MIFEGPHPEQLTLKAMGWEPAHFVHTEHGTHFVRRTRSPDTWYQASNLLPHPNTLYKNPYKRVTSYMRLLKAMGWEPRAGEVVAYSAGWTRRDPYREVRVLHGGQSPPWTRVQAMKYEEKARKNPDKPYPATMSIHVDRLFPLHPGSRYADR